MAAVAVGAAGRCRLQELVILISRRVFQCVYNIWLDCSGGYEGMYPTVCPHFHWWLVSRAKDTIIRVFLYRNCIETFHVVLLETLISPTPFPSVENRMCTFYQAPRDRFKLIYSGVFKHLRTDHSFSRLRFPRKSVQCT